MAWTIPRTWSFNEHTVASIMNPGLRDQLNALWVYTTKGDLAVHNGADLVRLPVGTDGQVLLADSAEATGLRWGTNTGISLGNSHAHVGGSGAQVDHVNLANKGTNTHAQADTHVGDAAAHLSHGVSHAHTGGIDGAQVDHVNLNGVGTNTHTQIDTHLAQPHIPVGAIIYFYGLLSAVPSGWKMCDGTGGTPDLRDKFAVGAGSAYSVGATGGGVSMAHTHTSGVVESSPKTHTHTAGPTASADHTHSISATGYAWITGHIHTLSGFEFGPGRSDMNYVKEGTVEAADAYHMHEAAPISTSSAAFGSHNHSMSISGLGAHTHTITLNNNSFAHLHSSPAINPMLTSISYPPYKALYYIRRIT